MRTIGCMGLLAGMGQLGFAWALGRELRFDGKPYREVHAVLPATGNCLVDWLRPTGSLQNVIRHNSLARASATHDPDQTDVLVDFLTLEPGASERLSQTRIDWIELALSVDMREVKSMLG